MDRMHNKQAKKGKLSPYHTQNIALLSVKCNRKNMGNKARVHIHVFNLCCPEINTLPLWVSLALFVKCNLRKHSMQYPLNILELFLKDKQLAVFCSSGMNYELSSVDLIVKSGA